MRSHHLIVMLVCAFAVYLIGCSFPTMGNKVLALAGM